ncbi:efflux RND transporter periplasmic adaptor subunit [Aliiglaciecola litoralis]|uniref:Multidrug efflux RND transporter periplasmic adaptor subunit VmeJ n=1 Tax=Aliiglaciecola litoralis TaxID=582857 RepID=A0ABN1LS32_9ALTE
MSRVMIKIRQQPAWIALFIFILLCLWVASGYLTAQTSEPNQSAKPLALTRVKVETLQAEQVSSEIKLYGRTEPNRVATLRSEVKGLVTGIYAQEGESVKQGQRLITLESNDLAAQLKSANAVLQQRKIELQGAQSLGEKGYQSQSSLAQARANVELANAEIERLQLALKKTTINAPFDGVINKRNVEIGDLLRDGDTIATLVDLQPLIISANVTENWVQKIHIDMPAFGRLVNGQSTQGVIRYISSVSNPGTNTFNLEVEIANTDRTLVAGMSTELTIPIEKQWAIKITPAVMALDEAGNIGVKIVKDRIVKFVPIKIVKSDSDGVWLSGLGREANVITRGQGFVRDGDEVEAIFEPATQVRTSENHSSL